MKKKVGFFGKKVGPVLAELENARTFAIPIGSLSNTKSSAGIAQLVEHNLAKVGVASSSLVSRSNPTRVVKSVDTQDLKSCAP